MGMQKILIVFFIGFLFLSILVFPFKIRFMGHANLLELKCFYSVKIWLFKILCGKAVWEDGQLKVSNDNSIFDGAYDKKVKILVGELVKKINIKKVELFFTGGFSENSFSSAIVCGSVLSLVETVYGYLSLIYEDVKMYKDIEPTFDNDNLELTVDLVASISIFQILIANIKAFKQLKKIKEAK